MVSIVSKGSRFHGSKVQHQNRMRGFGVLEVALWNHWNMWNDWNLGTFLSMSELFNVELAKLCDCRP
jgi:hypothetical protein